MCVAQLAQIQTVSPGSFVYPGLWYLPIILGALQKIEQNKLKTRSGSTVP